MADYFEFLDFASVGKTYDWASLHIDLNFDKREIDLLSILDNTRAFGDSMNEALFIHEYVHYLQNFFTTWGALVFCEYLFALEKIGASSLEEHFKLTSPIKLEAKAGMELWNAGVQQYQKFFTLLGTDRGIIPIERLNTYPNYSVKEYRDHTLTINNGLISYTVDNKTVREHMAELSSLLFLNYSDAQIHERFMTSSALCSSAGNLDKQPVYWMLFEFFYFHEYTNIGEGLVQLTHGALRSLVPYMTVERFFKFAENKRASGAGRELLKIVREFLSTAQEIKVIQVSFNNVMEKVDMQDQICKKHSSDNDLYRFSHSILAFLRHSISTYQSADLFFGDPLRLKQKEFWSHTIAQTGTPIVRYKDKTPVITTFSNNLMEALIYFLGLSKVLQNLQDSKTFSCPFHSEFNICKAPYRNDDTCLHEPLLVKNPDKDGKECHYQNAILLLGLKDRLL